MTIKTAEALLSPISVFEFVEKYLEKEVLFLQRHSPSLVEGLFDLESLGQCLKIARPYLDGRVRVLRKGEPERSRLLKNVSKKEAIARLTETFAEGHTIILNGAEDYWQPVADLCDALQETLVCAVSCNIYCTPPVSQGFETHVDNHDVIILQTQGSKTWRTHETHFELPLESRWQLDEFRSELKSAEPEYGDPNRELVLNPGDVLYLPRGVPHSAMSNSDATVHFTIGLHPVRTHALLHHVIDMIAHRDVRLRQRIDHKIITGAESPPTPGDLLREIAKFADELDEPFGLDRLLSRFRETLLPMNDLAGAFRSASQCAAIHLNTRVARPPGTTLSFRDKGEELWVICGSSSVALPLRLRDAISFLTEREELRIGEIPDKLLSKRSKVVFIRHLLKHGLLRITELGDKPPIDIQEYERIFSTKAS
ncbi:MAG: cupin domain-containing protein [Pseudomonadota bacterium]